MRDLERYNMNKDINVDIVHSDIMKKSNKSFDLK